MSLRRDRLRTMMGPVVGIVLGVADSVISHVPVVLGEVGSTRAERSGWSQVADFASLILDSGWLWAAAAVLAGRLAGRRVRPGALAGGLALICATASYYAVDLLFDGGLWWDWRTRFWVISSVTLGPALGAVGALIRRPGPVGTVAALVVPAGAALQMVLLPPAPESRMAEPVRWSVWVAAAIASGLIVRHNGPGRGRRGGERPCTEPT